MRSEHSLFKIGPFTNRNLNLAALVSVALVALVMFTPLSIVFGLVRLPLSVYLEGIGLIFVPLLVLELAKLVGLVRHPHQK